MIVRDEHGIVIQPDTDNATGITTYCGGDSAARTGILALSSVQDNKLWGKFFDQHCQLVRHPYQPKWNDPKETSRDQLVQFFVPTTNNMFAIYYSQQWFINKDFLDPAVKLYLYRCSPLKPPALLEKLGTLWMHAAMWWNTKVKPHEEMNMFCCLCIKAGPAWVRRLYDEHPDIEANIRAYCDGWRQIQQVGDSLINKLREMRDVKETSSSN